MKRFIEQWEALCASSPILRFVDINLRGVGQVMFQDNPLTGLLFLTAIAWGSVAARAPEVFIAGAIAVVTATLAAIWLPTTTRSSLSVLGALSVAKTSCRSWRTSLGAGTSPGRACSRWLRITTTLAA